MIRGGWCDRDNQEIVAWGLSRFGDAVDPEMAKAAYAEHVPGDGDACAVGFTPEKPKLRSAEQMRAQRIRNMQRRIQKQAPLFAEQFEQEELARDYYSLERCEADRTERAAYLDEWVNEFWETHTEDTRVLLREQARTA